MRCLDPDRARDLEGSPDSDSAKVPPLWILPARDRCSHDRDQGNVTDSALLLAPDLDRDHRPVAATARPGIGDTITRI